MPLFKILPLTWHRAGQSYVSRGPYYRYLITQRESKRVKEFELSIWNQILKVRSKTFLSLWPAKAFANKHHRNFLAAWLRPAKESIELTPIDPTIIRGVRDIVAKATAESP